MPKIFSFRFALFIVGLLLLTVIVMFKKQPMETLDTLKPIASYPDPQNGYGSGNDQLAQPDDVELQADGNVIITDVDNNRIQYFDAAGQLIRSTYASDMGLQNIEITPTGIGQDDDGYIYVTLEGAGTIARFSSDMQFDKFIGHPGEISAADYYLPENNGQLINPQGIIVSAKGDVFVIDMAKKVFKKNGVRNFGFRRFNKIHTDVGDNFVYDTSFASTQDITTIMRKSEGMAISEERGLLFVAEEKPSRNQFGNIEKFRYIGVFDLNTGAFLDRLIGVTMENDSIVNGYCSESIEGLTVMGEYLFAVAEKAGRVDCYNIDTGERVTHFGTRAPYYCDDESDCIIDGINYNEQSIMAGTAKVHLLNDSSKNEMASPDGICAVRLENGKKRLAVVDQWNSRILLYDLTQVLGENNASSTDP